MTAIRLSPEKAELAADGHSLCYIPVELVDEEGNVVPGGDVCLTAEATGAGSLAGFGSGNPITSENYTAGKFTTYRGRAMAVVRSGYEAGDIEVNVKACDDSIPAVTCRVCVR